MAATTHPEVKSSVHELNAKRIKQKLASKKRHEEELDPAELAAREVGQIAQALAENKAVPVPDADFLEPAVAALPEIEPAVAALPGNAGIVPPVAASSGLGTLGSVLGGLALAGLAGGGGGGGGGGVVAPKTVSAGIDPNADTGTKADGVSKFARPALQGSADPGAKVRIELDTNDDGKPDVVLETVADANGNWTATPDQPLPDGPVNARVVSTVAGVSSAPSLFSFVVDTTLAAPAPTLASSSDSGTAGDGITNDNTPTINGSGAAPGDTITVVIGGQILTTVADANGNWSVSPTTLPDGAYTAQVTSSDAAGNTAGPVVLPITIDTTPALTADLAAASDSGSSGDRLTNDNTPTITGTGTPDDAIKVVLPTGETLNTTVAADGTWSVTPTQALPDGQQTANVTTTDPAGNSTSLALPLTIDTQTPLAPTALLSSSSDSGAQGDGLTNNNTPEITGTGKPGDTITVVIGGQTLTALVAPNGTWSVTPTSLPDGPYNAVITATDPAGNVSPATTVPITVDTKAPALTAMLDPASESGTAGDGITNDNTPTLSGTGEPGADITVEVAGQILTTTVAADGTWAVTPNVIADGEYIAKVTQTDAAGNTTTADVALEIDTILPGSPVVSILTDANNDANVNAAELNGSANFSVQIALPANAVVGDTLEINSGNGPVFIVLDASHVANGKVITNVPAPAEGTTLTVNALLKDAAGNQSPSHSDAAKLDTTAADAPRVNIDTDASDNGVINDAELQGNTTVNVSITLPPQAVAGDTLRVQDSAGNVQSFLLSATDIANGTVQTTFPIPEQLADITVSATLVDQAGNASSSGSDNAQLDTLAPGAPEVRITADANNDGLVSRDEANTAVDLTARISLPSMNPAAAGDTLNVWNSNGNTMAVLLTASDIANGYVDVHFPMPSDATGVRIRAEIVDRNSNVSSAGEDIATMDFTAPSAPQVQIMEDANNNAYIAATELDGKIDVRVTLPVDAKALDTLHVTDQNGNVVLVTLTADPLAAGYVDVQFPAPAEGATITVAAHIVDLAGNVGPTGGSDSATLDTLLPGSLTATLAPASDSATQGDTLTNDNTPTISGTGEPGASITVVVAGQTLTTVVAANGTWSVTPTTLTDGPYTAAIKQADAAGNTTNTTTNVVIDTVAPSPLTAILAAPSDSGTLGDTITNDNTPKISGTGEPGAKISVVVGGQTLNTTVAADGSWSVTPTTLVDGPYTANVTQTDAAGNTSNTTAAVIVDTAAPSPLTALLASASDSGVPGDTRTNDNTPTISGTGEPGAAISVVLGGQTLTTTVAPDGTWSVTPLTLLDGSYTAAVTQTDSAGNTSTASAPVTIDTVAPGPLTSILATASDSGVQGDTRTNDNTPSISGTGEPGAAISVVLGGQTLTTTVAPDGTWSVTPTTLVDGSYSAAVTQTDAAGNTSTASAPVIVDTAAPALTATLDPASDSGVQGDTRTNDTTPTIKGTGEPGAAISVVIGGQTLTTTVAANGTWSVTPTALADGPYTAAVTQTDAAGNSSTASVPVIVDTSPPSLTAALAPASDSATLGDTLTNDNTPTISGTGEPGASITVVVAGQTLTTVVAADGTWSVTPTTVIDGQYTANITQTDASGNSSTTTAAVIVDTAAPGPLTGVLAPASDSGVQGDNRTNDNTPTISGTGEPGAVISVVLGGQTLTTTVAADGTWSVTPATLVDGSYTAAITQTDAAGNSATASAPVTIDTAAPGPLTAVLDPASNSATQGDTRTNDNTPTISGTGEPGAAISVVLGGQTLTTTVAPDGTWSVTPLTLLDGSYTAAVTQTDAAGNTSSASAPVVIDTVATAAPSVTINTDANNDGFMNTAEIGNATTVSVTVGLPAGSEEGDTLVLNDGTGTQTIVLTAAMLTAGNVNTTVARPAEGVTLTVSAQLRDVAGNTSPSGSDAAKLDTTPIAAPTVIITTDADNNGFMNALEVGSNTTASVTVGIPATAAVGDVMNISDNAGNTRSYVLTAADIGAGTLATTFPLPAEGANLQVTATLTDKAGNVSAAGTDNSVKDTFAPGAPDVTILDDANNDGYINIAEAASKTTVTVRIGLPLAPPFVAEAGQTLTVTDNQGNTVTVVLTQADIDNQTVDISVPMPANGTQLQVTAKITDLALNDSPSAYDIATVDTTAPAAPSIEIREDVNNNGYISASELSGQIDLRITLPSGAQAGDTLKVVNNQGHTVSITLTVAHISAGVVDTSVPAPAEGANLSVTAQLVDIAGNNGAVSAADTAIVDTTAPSPLTGALANSSDSGVQGDTRTNDTTPTISGTGEPGAAISVVVGGQTLTTVVAANGTWSVTPATLADGSYTAAITQTDAAGNTSTASTPVIVDTAAPATTAVLAPSSDSGVQGDTRTNDSTPTISGTGEPGAAISVVIGGQTLTTTVAPNGTWSVTPTTLPDGTYTAAVTQTDAAGNSSTASAPVIVDTSAPGPLTARLAAASDSGVAGDTRTNDNTPTISGTGEPGASISVLINGQTLTATVAPDGTWSVTPTSLADGTYTAAVTQTDAAGNTATTSTSVIVDTTAPALAAVLDPASDSGTAGDTRTNDNTPSISGTGEAGSSITVVIGGQTLTTTVAANGTWSVTPTTLVDGTYSAAVTQTDAAGNSSTANTSVIVDTTPPALTAALAPTSDSGTAGDTRTNDNTPTISGTGEAGSSITVVISGQTLLTTVAANGTWSVTPTTLVDGTYSAVVTQTDTAGNSSTASAPVTIDTIAPGPLTGALAASSDSGVQGDNRTNDTTPTISGTGEPGAAISVVIGGQTLTTVVAANGTWSVTPAALIDGSYTATITQTDAAGNSSSATAPVIVDTTPPALTARLDATSDLGSSNSDTRTSDNTPTISGTGEAGSSITVVVAGQTLTTTVAANGTWSVTAATMADGNYTAVVTEVDTTGNSVTANTSMIIDTVSPTNVTLASIAEDVRSTISLSAIDANGPVVSGITSVTFNSLPSGGTLYRADGITPISLGQTISGSELASLKVQSNLHSSSTISFSVTAVDAAGNSGTITVTQPVRPIADADPITIAAIAAEVTTSTSLGLRENQFAQTLDLDVLAPASSANGFAQRTRVSVIAGAMDTTASSSTAVDRTALSVAAHSGTYMSKFTGLIYLKAGTYTANTNGVNVDETLRLDLGGNTMLTVENWGSTPSTTSLVVAQAGFYTLDAYFMNFSGPGAMPLLHLSKDGGANVAINTSNFKLFRTVADAESAVVAAGASGLSDLQGSRDGMNGYYTTNREGRGAAGDLIKLQSVSVSAVDTDGSETNTLVLSNVPEGMTIISGANSFTATAGNTSVNVTGWNLTTLSVQTGSDNAAGTFTMLLTSTSKETVGGDTATATANLTFDIELNTRTFSGTSGDNTGAQAIVGANGGNRMFGGGGADEMIGGRGNDMIYGGSAGTVRNGGFEYWNLGSDLITGGETFFYQQFNASTINATTGSGALGGWISGGAPRQGSGTQTVAELLTTSWMGAGSIAGSGRFGVDLSANESGGEDLHLRQAITTLPGQTYTLSVVLAHYGNNADVVDVLWGDVVIARIASDTAHTTTMYHGYAAPVVTAVLDTSGGATNFLNYTFTVKGNGDAATTNLAIQADMVNPGNGNGRELLNVSLVPTSVDGNDRLEGGRGSDILFGQAGNDILIGGVSGNTPADAGSVDIGVFSFANNNGNDTFTDFEVGVDRLYLVDVSDSFQGSGNWASTGDAAHRSRYPGNPSNTDANATANSDNNLTSRDFTYANDSGSTSTATGQRNQYITVNANASGDLVINFNTNGGATGATNANMGSVTLTGVKYGSGAGQYDTVAELFGGNGATRLLWATTDGFKDPATTITFNGSQVQDFDWTKLTNIQASAMI